MAITKSAQKAIRSSARKRVFNLQRIKTMKEAVRGVKKLAGAGKLAEAKAALPAAYQAIDKAAKRGVIKWRAAARKKSRLTNILTSV